MACTAPIAAWRDSSGGVVLREPDISVGLRNLEGREIRDRREYVGYENLHLPCGKCTGCRMSKAREWAMRCSLEAQRHHKAAFVTLTYRDDDCPPFLNKAHLSAWVKRLRARVQRKYWVQWRRGFHGPRWTGPRFKFFACGEYGEQRGRPHYHALVFGVSDSALFESCWPHGFVRVDPVTPASISYVAGYVSKKYDHRNAGFEVVDPETGEVYEPMAEFRIMSRRPGIAALSREYWRSWRESMIWQGREYPVPRYLHEEWKRHVSQEEVEKLREEKRAAARPVSAASLEAAQRRFEVRQEQKSSTRRKF